MRSEIIVTVFIFNKSLLKTLTVVYEEHFTYGRHFTSRLKIHRGAMKMSHFSEQKKNFFCELFKVSDFGFVFVVVNVPFEYFEFPTLDF